ncbi:MAG: hypothetical protein RAK23_02530 [Thermoplasmata archaeon]|nr:hypothetical protein [Thermoplasmata archaeon]
MYKSRDVVEKHFDTVKNMWRYDIIYLRDDYSLFGHIFDHSFHYMDIAK